MTLSIKSSSDPKLWVLVCVDRYYTAQKFSDPGKMYSVSANYERSINLIQGAVKTLIDEISDEFAKWLKGAPEGCVEKKKNLEGEVSRLRTSSLEKLESAFKSALQTAKDPCEKAQVCMEHRDLLEGYSEKLDMIVRAQIKYRKEIIPLLAAQGGMVRISIKEDIYSLDKDTFLKATLAPIPEE